MNAAVEFMPALTRAVRAQVYAHPNLSQQGHITALAREGYDGQLVRDLVAQHYTGHETTLAVVLQFIRNNPDCPKWRIREAMITLGRNPNSVNGLLALLRKRKLVTYFLRRHHAFYRAVPQERTPITERVFAAFADGVPRRFLAIYTRLEGEGLTQQQVRNALVQLYQGGRIAVRGPRKEYEYQLPDPVTGGGAPGAIATATKTAIRMARLWPAQPAANGPQLRISA